MSIGSDLRTARQLRENAQSFIDLAQRVDELSKKIEAFAATYNKTVEALPEAEQRAAMERNGS